MVSRDYVGGWVAVVVAVLVAGTVVTPVSAAPNEWTVHIVRRGETVYSIARSYGLDI